MFQRDLVLRAIEQLGAAVARLAGLVQAEKYEEALEGVREAKGGLPLVPGLEEQLDVTTLHQMLREEHARLLARLWGVEADALEGVGRRAHAAALRQRSRRLMALLGPPAVATEVQ